MRINVVTGRVHELIHDFERPQLRETARRNCRETRQSANALVAA